MSAHSGPNIVEDGLVLALDAANEKSFRGEPTTNEFVQITWGGDGGPTIATVTDQSLMYKGYFTQSIIGGTSRNCYLHSADISTSRTSDVWTFSCYLRREDKQPITSMNVYMYYPSSDGSAAATIEDVGDGWYRLSRTRTGAVNYIGLAGFTGLVAGVKYYLSGAQLEKKAYLTPYVNTNTTRGTTVATGGGLIDLSNNSNNGELINGPIYDSSNKGSMVFDGSNDRVIIPTINLGNGNLPWTAAAWIKTTTNASTLGAGSVLSNSSGGPVYSMMGVNNGKIVYWTYYSGAWQKKLGTGKTVNDGQWHYLVWVNYSNSTMDMYVDGVLDSNVGNSTSGNNNPINIIGSSWAATFSGNISNISIYNVALSANQINNNFNALRGRYGI